jgi:hypothetical protein
MNANELADELEHYLKGEEYDRLVWEIPDMLRQQQTKLEKSQELLREYTALHMKQQAEIEALKNRNWDLVSEPWGFDRHPAKTLTDEEIYSLAVENGAWKSKESGNVYPDDLELLDFARAILRKAQEK